MSKYAVKYKKVNNTKWDTAMCTDDIEIAKTVRESIVCNDYDVVIIDNSTNIIIR